MPYTDDPAGNQSDAVRLHVGDTDNDDLQLTDNEVSYILSLESNVIRAASRAAQVLAGKYARQVDSEIDEIRLRAQERFGHYKQLAIDLAALASTAGGGMKMTGIYFGGISKSRKDTLEDDSDRVQPSFTKDMHTINGNVTDDIFDETLEN